MTGNSTNSTKKQPKENIVKNKSNVAQIEEKNLLEIKKEINLTLKDLFEDYDKRIEKIELYLFDKETKNTKDKSKAPEHCYN